MFWVRDKCVPANQLRDGDQPLWHDSRSMTVAGATTTWFQDCEICVLFFGLPHPELKASVWSSESGVVYFLSHSKLLVFRWYWSLAWKQDDLPSSLSAVQSFKMVVISCLFEIFKKLTNRIIIFTVASDPEYIINSMTSFFMCPLKASLPKASTFSGPKLLVQWHKP